VLLKWLIPSGDKPLAAGAVVEAGQLLPQALSRFSVELPEEQGLEYPFTQWVLRIDPPIDEGSPYFLFDVWFAYEDQGWNSDFGWDSNQVDFHDTEESMPFDDLHDALLDGDEKGIFDAFTHLTGGQIEFVDWVESPGCEGP